MSEQAFHGPEEVVPQSVAEVKALADELFTSPYAHDHTVCNTPGVLFHLNYDRELADRQSGMVILRPTDTYHPMAELVITRTIQERDGDRRRLVTDYIINPTKDGGQLYITDELEAGWLDGLLIQKSYRTKEAHDREMDIGYDLEKILKDVSLQPASNAETAQLIQLLRACLTNDIIGEALKEVGAAQDQSFTESVAQSLRSSQARNFWRRIFMRWL